MDTKVAIRERLAELIDRLGLNRLQFAQKVGLNPSNLSAILAGKRTCGVGIINKVVLSFDNINRDWLMTGEGDMFTDAPTTQVVTLEHDTTGIPVYDLDATCGMDPRELVFTNEMVIGSVRLPYLRPDCKIIRANGDSMQPVIRDGDWIAVREIHDFEDVFYGQIYLVITEEYRMIKYIRRYAADETQFVILRSANADYDDIKISKAKILRLFIIESILAVHIQL